MSRVKSDTGFSLGDTSDITREEVRFHKMVLQFTTRFKDVFSQLYISHLRLKGYADEYGITEHDFDVQMIGNNIFEEALETDILTRRSENFERFVGYTETDPETGKKALFNLNWLMRKFLKFTDDDISENDMWLEKDKTNYNTENSGGGEGGGSDSKGFGGGGGGGSDDFGSDSSGKEGGGSDSSSDKDSAKPDEKPEKPDNSKDLESFA